jgi:hypothetical protein
MPIQFEMTSLVETMQTFYFVLFKQVYFEGPEGVKWELGFANERENGISCTRTLSRAATETFVLLDTGIEPKSGLGNENKNPLYFLYRHMQHLCYQHNTAT